DEPALVALPPTSISANVPSTRFAQASPESALPLFTPAAKLEDDEPLIRLPATPRAPLQVRRTPDTPSLRALTRPTVRPPAEREFQFSEESIQRDGLPQIGPPPGPGSGMKAEVDSSRPSARVAAVGIDLAILLGIDFGILYLTVRMAGLPMSEWN